MKRALNQAKIHPDELSYINAHGTSTPLNDKFETMAIKNVMGEKAFTTPISSTKSMTGHLLGASGALEAVITIMSISDQVATPTINLTNAAPDCDLDYTPNRAQNHTIDIAMTNSFGFGGHNASIIFKKLI